MSPDRTVTDVRQTDYPCPTQWEGQLQNGEYLYARYRWGYLTVGSGATLEEAIENYSNVFSGLLNTTYDGYLPNDEMLGYAGLEYDPA